MEKNLTAGSVTKTMLLFTLPMVAGNILQQLYNIADTLIVGKYLGSQALASVGTAYTLMVFLTSIISGLCMGSGALFSLRYGEKNIQKLQESIFVSFIFIGMLALLLSFLSIIFIDQLIHILHVPEELRAMLKEYLVIIFSGIIFTFLYNYCAALLRSVGDSASPLLFLAVSAILNIVLDLYFVLILDWNVGGAAAATVIAQAAAGMGITVYSILRFPLLRIPKQYRRFSRAAFAEIARFTSLTCIQQSVMNFGILLIQGLVNSFGTVIMAAFTAAVKIDSFAYMPVQDFGNAFSTFTAQNYGAEKYDRIRAGIKSAVATVVLFCFAVSLLIWIFAEQLLLIFIKPTETEIIAAGIHYLRIEGTFYCGIGCLFLLYGFYRAIKHPGISAILTVISLGTRVVLAYILAANPAVGVTGIWAAIPAGWILADIAGLLYYRKYRARIFPR